jgi:uncharacterized membrane protein YphA (DoxX/SURF4 family)
MNIVLWILQVVLGLLYLAGGYYKAFRFEELASQFTAIPPSGWRALGVVEMLGAVLLIVPAATKWMPGLTPMAAAVLAIETLVISGVYGRHSLKLTAENPLVWSVAMLLLVVFVAYGRYAIKPLT